MTFDPDKGLVTAKAVKSSLIKKSSVLCGKTVFNLWSVGHTFEFTLALKQGQKTVGLN